jgi:formylglycine-generating enzyme required for sulfatase activity
MKEGPILSVLGIILLLMVLSSVVRMREIRSEAKLARTRKVVVVTAPVLDPARFHRLKVASFGRDTAPMVLIHGGTVIRGTEAEIGEFDERPARNITLSPYFIDLKEVSNFQYQKFIEKTSRHKQEVMIFFDDVSLLFGPNLPAVGVTWFDADAYCRWNGKRLPNEAEWEHAAGGNGLGGWPWGDVFIAGAANLRGTEDGYAYTAPVGSFDPGRSPYGLYDMAGNVEEWVYDWYDEFFYKEGQTTLPYGPDVGTTKVVRGGSWESSSGNVRATKRHTVDPTRKEAGIGFRCAMDAPQA